MAALQGLLTSSEDVKLIAKQGRDEMKAAKAKLKDVLEQTIQVGVDEPRLQKEKLLRAEQAWQDLTDAEAWAKDNNKAARDALKSARKELDNALVEVRQKRLPGVD